MRAYVLRFWRFEEFLFQRFGTPFNGEFMCYIMHQLKLHLLCSRLWSQQAYKLHISKTDVSEQAKTFKRGEKYINR